LRKLEERYAGAVEVIGVHSGKYITERITDRVRDASLRLDIRHPIVNDRQFRTWRAYTVSAWPTIVVINPLGHVVGSHAGEFTAEMVQPFLDDLVARHDADGTLVRSPSAYAAQPPTQAPGILRYPGGVAWDGSRMAIADSGHDRILFASLTPDRQAATVTRIVGGTRGMRDGDDPQFHSPQGVRFHDGELLVADAGNHAIRAVSPGTGRTRTLAGTGAQVRTTHDLQQGALSSPWDLDVVGDTIFVAMAGIHQVWTLPRRGGRCVPFSGSRREDIADGPHADAALAQPMGIAAANDALYFVDAESSAVRRLEPAPDGGVRTIVGTGLFDFGDEDGTGDDVRLQHPQGVAVANDGRLLISDTYNDALKWVDPRMRTVNTLARGLNEPGGLCLLDGLALVADTNAHRIAVARLADGAVSALALSVAPAGDLC
jgi:hypothetical protein